MSIESFKKRIQQKKEQQKESNKLLLENAQKNRREMALPFKFYKASIDKSVFPENAAILTDEYGDLVEGGWFTDPQEYPNACAVMSLEEFKQKAILIDDYYEVIVRGSFSDFYEDLEIQK